MPKVENKQAYQNGLWRTGLSVSTLTRHIAFEPWIQIKFCWERHPQMGFAMLIRTKSKLQCGLQTPVETKKKKQAISFLKNVKSRNL